MSQPIAGLSPVDAEHLNKDYLVIVESIGDNAETCHTTVEDVKNWIEAQFSGTGVGANPQAAFVRPEKISSNSINIDTNTSNTNDIYIDFKLPLWDNDTLYKANDLVQYKRCIYKSRGENRNSNPSTGIDWERLNYSAGRRVVINDDNSITSVGGIEPFDETSTYEVNDFVIYDKKLFQCKQKITTPGVWDKTKWLNIGEGNGIIPYEDGRAYDAGAIVQKDSKLYLRLTTGADIEWIEEKWKCISNGDYSNVYIKYSAAEPTKNTDMKDAPDKWMGIYAGAVSSPPVNYTDYTWYQIRQDAQVNVECNTVVKYITIETSDWVGSQPAIATFNDADYKDNMAPIIDINFGDDSSTWQQEIDNFSNITRVICNNGSIVFYCLSTIPVQDIHIKVRITGDVNSDSFIPRYEFNQLKNTIENILGGLNANLENALAGE